MDGDLSRPGQSSAQMKADVSSHTLIRKPLIDTFAGRVLVLLLKDPFRELEMRPADELRALDQERRFCHAVDCPCLA